MKTPIMLFLTAMLFATLWSCAAQRADVAWPQPRELGASYPAFKASTEPADVKDAFPVAKEPTGDLTLEQALSLAIGHNPSLAASAWEVRAREAGVEQAGLFPNPELDVSLEQIGGTGALSGFRAAQTNATLSQAFPIGGRLGSQTLVAKAQRDLSGWDWEAARLDLIARTSKAFVRVLAAQARLDLAQESADLAGQVLDAVSRRVEAGKVSPVQRMRARVSRATSRIELENAKRTLEAARRSLSATWGGSSPGFARAVGRFVEVKGLPQKEKIEGRLDANPDLARWEREIMLSDARVDLERSLGVPDLTIFAGMQRLEDTGDFAATVGISIPFPIFDRNQGAIREAEFERSAAGARRSAARVRIGSALEQAWQRLLGAYHEVVSLRDEALSGARAAFDAARVGYEEGKFPYLDMLDAQRTLFAVRGRHLEALRTYHEAVIDVQRLTGKILNGGKAGIIEGEEQ
ncbi:MAG: TolC family protein [Deltaproteobacteria bacterium]|nr:TolC family protein [Deltaproteobacteria bacterium]